MSQLPNSSEPPVGEIPTGSAQPQGTAGAAVQVDPQQKIAALEAQLAEVKGFQGLFTKAHQIGMGQDLKALLQNGNLAEAKAKWESMRSAAQVAAEVQQLGGLAKFREYHGILGDLDTPPAIPVGQSAPAMPGQAPVGQGPSLSADAIRAIVREETESVQNANAQAGYRQSAIQGIATSLGLPLNEANLRLLAGALNAELATVTAGARDPLQEEVKQAGQSVAQFLGAVRNQGAITTQPGPTIPPLMNGNIPGGQQPAPRPAQMNSDQKRVAARQLAETALRNQSVPQPKQDDLPKGFSMV